MPAKRHILLLALTSLLLFSILSATTQSTATNNDDDDEDLSFLEEPENDDVSDHHEHEHAEFSENEGEEEEEELDFENYGDFDQEDVDHEEDELTKFDEKDVIVLKEGNFSDFVKENKYVMVEFYAPWCGHCKAMAPEYAAAATDLKDKNVKLAKVDATEENDLAEKYGVEGFPTVVWFVNGEHKTYKGERSKDAIVTWINKKIGPGVTNITTTEEAERILTSENSIVLGFLDSLVGPDSEKLTAASKLDDNVDFYQTANSDVAKMFHLQPDANRPALVLLKKEAEKVTHFDGQFEKSAIVEFISANKLPLVTTFTKESASLIFENPIKKQLLLFATSNGSEKIVPTFEQAAKLFKGKLVFVYVDLDSEEVGRPVAEYFGITGDAPKVLGFTADEDTKKYVLDGEVTFEKIKAFGEAFVEDKLKPFYKSDPIPETNDGDVKIVVGNNFNDIVMDESKDVLLEIYAPWCGHCQSLEPTYNKLAKHLRGIESLVVAKMDGTTNENPRAKADGFPTILFFPAGKKSTDPISVDTERTVVAFYKFLKKHASIPFKLEKTVSSSASEDSNAKQDTISSSSDLKDEL